MNLHKPRSNRTCMIQCNWYTVAGPPFYIPERKTPACFKLLIWPKVLPLCRNLTNKGAKNHHVTPSVTLYIRRVLGSWALLCRLVKSIVHGSGIYSHTILTKLDLLPLKTPQFCLESNHDVKI